MVSENLVSEKNLGFGEFSLGEKVSVSVSENLVSEKKSWYRFWSKFWYRHSVANIYTDFCVDGINTSVFAILLFSKVVDMYNTLFLLLVLMKIFFTFALTAYFYCCYCALF